MMAGVHERMGLIPAPAYHPEPRYHAPLWRRLAAFMIDIVVVVVAFIPVSLALDAIGAAQWLDRAGYVVWPVYFLVLWTRGATIGMHAMDLRLVGADFAAPATGAVVVRWLAWVGDDEPARPPREPRDEEDQAKDHERDERDARDRDIALRDAVERQACEHQPDGKQGLP
jgi:RDD family protein